MKNVDRSNSGRTKSSSLSRFSALVGRSLGLQPEEKKEKEKEEEKEKEKEE